MKAEIIHKEAEIHMGVAVEIKPGLLSSQFVEQVGNDLLAYDKAHVDGAITILATIPIDALYIFGIRQDEARRHLADSVPDHYHQVMPVEVTQELAKHGLAADATYMRLREWRWRKAREVSVPSFFILSNRSLAGIAEALPSSLEALAKCQGMSRTKLAAFGPELLEVIAQDRQADLEPGVSTRGE